MKINTTEREYLIKQLIAGLYLIPTINIKGKPGYRLYKDNQVPVRTIKAITLKGIVGYLKKDKRGRLTINLSALRQVHGKNKAKKIYKQLRPKKEKKLSRSIEFD